MARTIEELESIVTAQAKRIELLDRQQSVQTEALRRLIEGRWVGPLPTAAAFIASLYGPTPPADFKPVPFPAR